MEEKGNTKTNQTTTTRKRFAVGLLGQAESLPDPDQLIKVPKVSSLPSFPGNRSLVRFRCPPPAPCAWAPAPPQPDTGRSPPQPLQGRGGERQLHSHRYSPGCRCTAERTARTLQLYYKLCYKQTAAKPSNMHLKYSYRL